ncbi:MAG: GTP-binding protein [Dehalococcoidales bacterium]|nr:GTP-binding protein [Dehalococcoidales bacterium]
MKGGTLPGGGPRITIIGGFLGSGKTTLLKRLLTREFDRGIQPQVIMSEFGDFDVDSQVIADERLRIMAVISGCICCSSKDELSDAVTSMLQTAPDRPIFIESTGVADPSGVLQAVVPIAGQEGATITGVVVVYDASRKPEDNHDRHLIERQLMTADVVVANKYDLVTGNIEEVEQGIRSINPVARIVGAVHCDIDLEQITQGTTACFATQPEEVCTDDEYTSLALRPKGRLDRHSFESWLSALPEEVLRVKGFVLLEGETGFFEVQWSPAGYDITPMPSGRWMDAVLVIISHPLPAESLVSGLRQCMVR